MKRPCQSSLTNRNIIIGVPSSNKKQILYTDEIKGFDSKVKPFYFRTKHKVLVKSSYFISSVIDGMQ